MYIFHFEILSRWIGPLLLGLLMTIKVSALAMILGMVVGLGVAFVRMARHVALRESAVIYIEIARGMPVLVLIFWFYYGLPILTGVAFSGLVSGVAALTLKYAGYLAEIFRAGIEAIKTGQREAAYSLGFSRAQTMRRIILPQAIRIVVPPLGSAFVGMLQDSALVSIIGVTDLMRQGQLAVASTFRPFELYTIVALLYLATTVTFSKINDYMEKRRQIIQ
ncbi:MAG: amino acid ABC transporter permease [Deltaproteobacteria bacterium]|nr:amino acid ABC transporter permease [Deltaproteobacteria bacterium]MBW2121839.1 amino acid ABC transporter permease [Deltaproteobacteria bacterium]